MLLKLALFFHITAAVFWIGGMLFLTLVVVPYLKTIPDPADRSRIYQVVGTKFRFYGWIAVITLLITGPLVLYKLYGILPQEIFRASFHSTRFGMALGAKLVLVFIIVASSLVHDFFLGPKAKTSPKYSMLARIFGRSNLIIAIFIVVLAVILRAGGF
ncbi:MAG: hypothetical protein AAB356_07255 [Deltaproteobacteria bacterium]